VAAKQVTFIDAQRNEEKVALPENWQDLKPKLEQALSLCLEPAKTDAKPESKTEPAVPETPVS
jgi:hypothetical protein